ncbi:MAG: glycosyltransferase [Planctomycetota bacterium]
MSEPRVSIIIRTFNRPDMLKRALDSVASQTWTNREVVVVNDAGCDVKNLLDELAPKMPQGWGDIVYLNFDRANKPGRCLAATKGIEASSGEWICYLDDDDFYYPNHLEVLMDKAATCDSKVFYTDANRGTEEPVGKDGAYVITTVGPGPSEDFSQTGFYVGCYIHLVTFCHHRSVFDAMGGFDTSLDVLEDLDLFFRYSQDHDFVHVPIVTGQFQIRTDNSNAVTAMRDEFVQTREQMLAKYLHTVVRDLMISLVQGKAALAAVNSQFESVNARIKRLEDEMENLKEKKA